MAKTVPIISFDKLNTQQNEPYFIYHSEAIKKSAHYFKEKLNAAILYAVKANPSPFILKDLYQAGIKDFDFSSLEGIKHLRSNFPNATLYFMNPVKPRYAIRQAYWNHQFKHFSLESQEALDKILQETQQATDLHLHLRLSIPNTHAELDMSQK